MKSLRKLQGERGFTLVEVVLALGISTFSLVSVLGLLSAATNTDSQAGRDTVLVSMSDYVLNEMQSVPFDALWSVDPTTSRDTGPSTNSPENSTYYFTNEGTPLPASTAASSFDLLYKCVVTKTPDDQTQNLNTGNYNQLKLQLTFSWPASFTATSGKAGTKSLYASIGRH
jgi:uncharacterized protein (TIGR02598 family)